MTQHQEEVYSPLSGLPFSYNRCGLKNATGNLVFPENFYRFEYIGENRIVGYQYDFTSNASGGITRHVRVYDFNGKLIEEYKGAFDIETTNDKYILFDDENNLRHIIYFTTGTVIIDELGQ